MRKKKRRKTKVYYGALPADATSSNPRIKNRVRRTLRQKWFPVRFNRTAVWSLIGTALLSAAIYLVVVRINQRNIRNQVLDSARTYYKESKLDKKNRDINIDKAVRNLDLYLAQKPNDISALELQSEITGDTARNIGEANRAIALNDRLLRLDPQHDDPDRRRDETRRRLVKLYVQVSDAHNASAAYRLTPDLAANDRKYQAAEKIAEEILYETDDKTKKPKEVDKLDDQGKPVLDDQGQPIKRKIERKGTRPDDHRLMAMALQGLAVPGEPGKLAEAIEHYQEALRRKPDDADAADRLSLIYRDRYRDLLGDTEQGRKQGAEQGKQVLDSLVEARDTTDARLIRYHYFMKLQRYAEAGKELEAATRLASSDLNVRLTAASDAVRRGKILEARQHLAAIPLDQTDQLPVKVMVGMINFAEQHPDQAITDWREGLKIIGGTDAELTWWLAHALLQMGKVSEAYPLVKQYYRLAGIGDEAQPLYNYLMAELEEKIGRPTRAILILDRVKERIGDNWQSMVNVALGRCYESIWDETRALTAYRRANLIDPRLIEPRLASARLLASKPDEAVQEIQRGLEQSPDDATLQVVLVGALLRQQAAREPAKRSWREYDQAMIRANQVTEGKSALLFLFRADWLALNNNISGAVALLRNGTLASPKNVEIWIALAEGLNRTGQHAEALKVLEEGSSKDAAGDNASIRIARARLLLSQGRGREARQLLVVGDQELGLTDRAQVWEALGRIDASRGDIARARVAFSEWSRILNDDPRPRLALLELAEAASDSKAAKAEVENLLKIGGQQDIAWQLCQAQLILWDLQDYKWTARDDPRNRQLDTAEKLISNVLIDAPEVPAALFLHGQVLEKLKPNRLEEAYAAYEKAYRRGVTAVLPRLVDILAAPQDRVKLDVQKKLADLRLMVPGVKLDQLSALSSYRAGDIESTKRFVEQAGEANDRTPGSVAWQARMFELSGDLEKAEATLRAAARDSTDVDPWIALVQSLGSHGKALEASAAIEEAKGRVRSPNLPLDLARMTWFSGARAAADRAFEALLASRPDDLRLQATASRYYEETGRRLEAIRCLRDARKIAPGDRTVIRQLATVLAVDPATWAEALSLIGEDDSTGKSSEDRLARGMVLSSSPDSAHRDRAIVLYEGLIQDLPIGNVLSATARDRLIRMLLQAGRAEQAVQIAALAAETGTDRSAVFLFGEALFLSGNPKEAIRQIERLEAFNPDDAVSAEFHVRYLMASTTPGEVAEELERLVTNKSVKPVARALGRAVFHALIAMGPKGLDRAERVAWKIAEVHPTASWMTARVLIRKKRISEAIELCRTAAESTIPEDRRGAAEAAMEVATTPGTDPSDLASVDSILQNALRGDPSDYTVLVVSAMLRHLQGRFEEEARLYQTVLENRPGDPVASNNLAWALSEHLNRANDALAVLDEMIRRNGRVVWSLDTRGVVLTRLGRFDEAIRDVHESAGEKPTTAHLFHLARACLKANRIEDFQRYREQARKQGIKPDQVEPTERDDLAEVLAR